MLLVVHIGCLLLLAVLTACGGCRGVSTPEEDAARRDLSAVAVRYRPGDTRPRLPVLTAASGIDEYLRYAMFRSPAVEAAY